MQERIINSISEQLCIDASKITLDSDFISDLNADSLDIVQMLITMESEYGVEFDDDEIAGIKTVGDIVKFVESRAK
ncbi:MAG: acyl carrier protein [Clostridia bacterium]|nr:acyl carrier protein [Clostridia bacterium]